MKRLNVLLAVFSTVFLFFGCQSVNNSTDNSSSNNSNNSNKIEFVDSGNMPKIVNESAGTYCGTWSSSQYFDKSKAVPISDRWTLRQVVRTSIGGEKIRLSLTNREGEAEMVINSVHIAKADGQGTGRIFTDTDTIVPFNGKSGVSIPAGEDVTSDTFEFAFDPLTELAITIYYETLPGKITGHVGARANSFYSPGNCLSADKLPYFGKFTQWYTISAIDVLSEKENKAVVCFGDSITDGRGTTDDKNNRWSDVLATRLQNNEATKNVAVLNQGIGATTVTGNGVARFNTDVLEQTGLSYVIILYGINDIIYANQNAANIINTYKSMISKLHKKNVLVYGGTILPFGASTNDYNANREKVRQTVNKWIRETSSENGGFDAVIDFDAAVTDGNADKPSMKKEYMYDGLHPGPAGYKAMGDAIDLELFTKTAEFKVEDSAAAAFNAKNIEQFRFPLPKAIAKGTEIIVNLKGKNNGKSGFRCWTVADDVWTPTSEQITSYARQNLPSGTFDLTIKLVPTDTAKYLLIKAPAYGEKIDDIDFTAVTFTIGGKEYSVDPSAEVITN
ncbi:MAG: SGNH/GDSL hydrolase family protein [Treponema sp.]|nr:SGNH/GDSL hydrolase family protein [Treponema sp.]